MANEKLKAEAKNAGVYQWQIAAHLGVSEPTLTRWLRLPLSEEKARRIKTAIEVLAKGVS